MIIPGHFLVDTAIKKHLLHRLLKQMRILSSLYVAPANLDAKSILEEVASKFFEYHATMLEKVPPEQKLTDWRCCVF